MTAPVLSVAAGQRTLKLEEGRLTCGPLLLLPTVDRHLTSEADPLGAGLFLLASQEPQAQRLALPLGPIEQLERYTACFRSDPFWMEPTAGTRLGDVPVETQYLLAKRLDGLCVLLAPLFSQDMRFVLHGSGEELHVVGDTDDAFTVSAGGLALFVAVGDDPYELMERAAKSVIARLGTGKLRREKPLPALVDSFGWCTWDAFYQQVSQEKVRQGLESFAAIGVPPRVLILDDGWQSERRQPTCERRLTDFAANEKFPGDLRATVTMAKGEFGIVHFLAWHAIMGYWGGVDDAALPGYGVESTVPFVPRIFGHGNTSFWNWASRVVGRVAPEHARRFYGDYHRYLRAQGVDGVKVDNQSSLESLGIGRGGRVAIYQAFRQALEESVTEHLSGNLINCMGNAQEIWYGSKSSNLVRSSTDFWPNRPESHGLHLYTNAQVSLWFSQFMHPDWDMFQSGHAMGAFHAAGRAVSGAPVYVSDKPGQHDAAVLRKLVCSDGTVLRCLDVGLPTLDCLFHNPTREDVLLKIFNRNAFGHVVGVFHARYRADEGAQAKLEGRVCPSDIPGISGDDFVLHAHHSGKVQRVARSGAMALALGRLSAEVVTIAPVAAGVAVIGLVDKFNASGAITSLERDGQTLRVSLRDGGRLALWAQDRPREMRLAQGQAPLAMQWDQVNHLASAVVPAGGPAQVEVLLG